ncbi:MAG: multiheme c-type cytochrome [Nitrospirota bacterium]|nr:multiheme c-type cytochrome [Nitrospirota bacterium]
MRRIRWRSFLVCLFLLNIPANPANLAFAEDSACISCHTNETPNIVSDFRLSKHASMGLDCSTCHGSEHTGPQDVANVKIPTPATCQACHPTQVEQFSKGKHAFAWAAITAMPTIHWQPMALIEGQKGCGGCHKLGLKSEQEIAQLKQDGQIFGVASCDACHTRHTFSKAEAQEPEACQTCHMGFDHPQWEMYSGSKHGVRYMLRRQGVLPETAAAPKCQTCHMQQGNHEVRTAWGFLAVRLPLPEDPQWAADQTTILQALGVLAPDGNPTARLDVVKAADVARLDQESFQKEREKMVAVCSGCHSENFARGELGKGDDMIRETDRLLAQAVQVVAGLYQDGVLQKPESYAYPFPDLLTFHDAPTPIEQRLFVMHLEHRMRAFQGTFHANPDYALWYGWSEMVRDLTDIRWMADEMRSRATLVTPTTVPPAAAGPLGVLLGSLQNLKR